MRFRGIGITLALAAGLTMAAGPAAAQPLKRDLGSYFIFVSKFARLKNLSVDNACNVGVNCAAPSANSLCGELIFDDVTFANGSQAVGDRTFCTKPGATLFQLFRNSGGPCNAITLNAPPITPFTPPIIAPPPIVPSACGANCTPNIAVLEALCGFPAVFPDCDHSGTLNVRAKPGFDCLDGPDSVPGNGQCDLPPGTYGNVSVRNLGKLNLVAGDYNVCSFKAGRNTVTKAAGTRILIPANGGLRVGGGSQLANKCNELNVLIKGTGRITFGRGVTAAVKVCAPAAEVKLGHGNSFFGQFVADAITANRDNHGQCCGGFCTCFDTFTPLALKAGQVLTLTGNCDLTNATKVKICGVDAMIISKTATELKVTVPAVAPGQCEVEVDSTQGNFVGTLKVTINP